MRYRSNDPELDSFYGEIDELNLQPLWEMSGLLTPTPGAKTRPHRWAATDLLKAAQRSGDLVPIDRGGDRRVLALSNPGLGGSPYIAGTLWAAVQFLRPRELAPAHRHTPGALRFILDGDGAYTLLDGDPVAMNRGDLVLTPSWVYHEHHNPTDENMMWLDVLDLPMVAALDAVFFEEGPSEQADQSIASRSASERLFSQGSGLLPDGRSAVHHGRPHSPLLVYRWAETDAALNALLELGDQGEAELRFTDPTRGGDVMPTIRCQMRRITGGVTSTIDQQTGSRVIAVLNGTGHVRIDDQDFALAPGDIYVVPSWAKHQISASSTLDLFISSDAPVLEALGLYREGSHE